MFGAYSLGRGESNPPFDGAAAETPLVVPVTGYKRFDRFRVEIEFETSPGKAHSNGHLTGVVTSLPNAAGRILESGETVLTVDDVDVIAMQSEAPLWRDLGFGAKGDDVVRLQRFLQSIGFQDAEPDGTIGGVTAAAIRSFNRSTGANADGLFHVSQVLWIGELPAAIETYAVEIGVRLSGGESIFRGPETLKGVRISEPDIPALAGEFLLEVDGTRVSYQPGSLSLTPTVCRAPIRRQDRLYLTLLELVQIARTPVVPGALKRLPPAPTRCACQIVA